MKSERGTRAVAVLLAAILVVSCGSDDPREAAGSATVDSATVDSASNDSAPTDPSTEPTDESPKEPLVFAILVGSPAEGGPDFENGMKVAIETVNASGGIDGRPIELRSFATDSTTAGAVAAYREAAADPEVVGAFFGAVSGALAVKAASVEVGLPIVIATASASVDRPLAGSVFHNSFAGEYATSAVRYAVEELGARRIAELHFATDYSVGITESLTARCAELDCEIVASESADAAGSVDALIPQLSAMMAENPDVYFIEGLNPNAFAAVRQLGIDAPIVSDQWLAVPPLRDACGVNCDGVMFAIHKANVLELLNPDDPLAPALQAYRAAYEDHIGSWAGFSIYGNDAVVVMAAAAHKIADGGERITRDALASAMESLSADDGLVTTHGAVTSAPDNHRLVGSWSESYVDVEIDVVDNTASLVLAPGADAAGSQP